MNNGYINQREMERQRIIIMKECNSTCKMCSGVATKLHHIDGSKVNHVKENFMPLCDKCHSEIHKDKDKIKIPKIDTDKINSFIALKGLSKKTFAKMAGMSATSLSIMLSKKSTKNETLKKIADILECDIQELFTKEYIEQLEKIDNKHYADVDGNNINDNFKFVTVKLPIKVYDAIWTNSKNPIRNVFKTPGRYIENIIWDIATHEVGDWKLLVSDDIKALREGIK